MVDYIQKFYVAADGSYIGSYAGPATDAPEIFLSAINVPECPGDASQKWDFDLGCFLPLSPKPYEISKTTPWLRMTEDEAAIMDAVMSETEPKLKQIYIAAQYLSSGDFLWSTLRNILAANLPGGDSRAVELLAPEN